ncbi:NACHT domain-containing protein [Fusarium acuminatum]|uniref:NACHT domain-containing protein n=1 Tax=Fusarium acuminatum TaxID=5515 RepID=A0ABZ2WFR3_9HYPO
MEPAGFAVGLSGLAGLFTSCLEIVQRYDTYKTASRDKRSLDVQQQGAIYRLKHWGISVGIQDGRLSDNHHPTLDNPETITLVNALLSNIKEFLDSPNDLNGPSGVQNVPSSGSEKLPRLERVAWALTRTLRDLSTWLGAPPPNDIYHDSSEKRLEKTCEWILHRDKFLQWQAPTTTAKVLWIKGSAGFGKTVLCAKLVQEVERTTVTPMAYFFLSTKFEGRENPFLAMRSWLTSLVLESQVAFDIVSKSRLSQHEQKAPQSTIIRLFGEITMAIPGYTKSVSHFLNELRKAITKTNTRLLILSRPAAVIQQGLSLFPGYSIYDIELDDVGPDLAAFASDVVKRKLTIKDEAWKLSIAQKIKDRCEGQFQWVKLQEGSLRRGLSKKRLEKVIDETPSGLDALYDREWNRINSMGSEDKQRALSLLRWAAFALYPLTVGQIAEAVLITEDCEELPVDERPECIDEDYIESMILELCGSLLEVRQPTINNADDIAEPGQQKQVGSGILLRDQEVHLTHFSVKEYILLKFFSTRVLLPNETLRSFIESQEHMFIAKCCLRYISFMDAWDETMQHDGKGGSRGFLFYAVMKWEHHYKLCLKHIRRKPKGA